MGCLRDLAEWWELRALRARRMLLGGAALLAIAVAAVSCGGSKAPDVVVRTATATATATATPTPTATLPDSTPSVTPTPSETPIPGPVVTSVKELVDKYGWPPGTDFARMSIPTIGVDAQVGARTVGSDAIMPAPAGPADIVWYDMSQWDGLGGTPGNGQNAVFSAHVDYADPVPYAKVMYRGQGVFSQINLLSQGDIVEVDYQGQTLRYKVVWRRQLSANGPTDWGSIWSSQVAVDSITLYTCGGPFDFKTREYEDRIVVRAERV